MQGWDTREAEARPGPSQKDAAQHHRWTHSCSWWTQVHSSNLPDAEARGTSWKPNFPLQARGSPHWSGERCYGRGMRTAGTTSAGLLQGMHSTRGRSSQLPPYVERLKLQGKKSQFWSHSFPYRLFSSTHRPHINMPQPGASRSEGPLALPRWPGNLGPRSARVSPRANQPVTKWGARGRERGWRHPAARLAQKIPQQV